MVSEPFQKFFKCFGQAHALVVHVVVRKNNNELSILNFRQHLLMKEPVAQYAVTPKCVHVPRAVDNIWFWLWLALLPYFFVAAFLLLCHLLVFRVEFEEVWNLSLRYALVPNLMILIDTFAALEFVQCFRSRGDSFKNLVFYIVAGSGFACFGVANKKNPVLYVKV